PMRQRDRVQHVQKLALVFVNALDLHIEEELRVDLDRISALQPSRHLALAGVLDRVPSLAKFGVVGVLFEQTKLREVALPSIADRLADQIGELRISLQQPAS